MPITCLFQAVTTSNTKDMEANIDSFFFSSNSAIYEDGGRDNEKGEEREKRVNLLSTQESSSST